MLSKKEAQLNSICEKMEIRLTDRQVEQFLIFYDYLIEKNRVMNLTAITDFDEVVIKHFADSLSFVRLCRLGLVKEPDAGTRIIDVGSGAGFPGIPLKILYPDTEFVLLDSLNKRVKFLNELIEKCRFENISACHARAEELAREPGCRDAFDYCLSRAVANLSVLLELCLPFVRPGGMFVSYKGKDIDAEMAAAKRAAALLGGKLYEDPVRFTLPDTDYGRSFVLAEKIKKTPSGYPRKPGMPGKMPL